MPDYLKQLQHVKTPEKAATLIRALALQNIAGLAHVWGAKTVVANVLEAEKNASTLERDYEDNDGTPIPKPWREWLKQWGYIPGGGQPLELPTEGCVCGHYHRTHVNGRVCGSCSCVRFQSDGQGARIAAPRAILGEAV